MICVLFRLQSTCGIMPECISLGLRLCRLRLVKGVHIKEPFFSNIHTQHKNMSRLSFHIMKLFSFKENWPGLSFLRMIWTCWWRPALLLSGKCCPWRGRLFWAPALRSSANHQHNNTQKRLWKSSSDTSTKTCQTLPRRRNLSDRLSSGLFFFFKKMINWLNWKH